MSSFTDRILARTRRHNERQARARGQAPSPHREVAQDLGIEVDQVAAIQKALSDQSLEPVVHTPGTAAYTAPEQPAKPTPREPQQATRASAPPSNIETTPLQGEGGGAGPLRPEPVMLPVSAPPSQLRVEFKSSNIRAAELGADGTLLVTFSEGAVYAFANFTPELLEEWQKAASPGNWFHHNVRKKPERYPSRKV